MTGTMYISSLTSYNAIYAALSYLRKSMRDMNPQREIVQISQKFDYYWLKDLFSDLCSLLWFAIFCILMDM